jgi:hypothetical protein
LAPLTKDYKLEDWDAQKLAQSNILEEVRRNCVDNIDRVDYGAMTEEEFELKYILPHKPVIIRGVAESWGSKEEFSWKVGSRDLSGCTRC